VTQDTAEGIDTASNEMFFNTLLPLIWITGTNISAFRPALAQSWTVSSDGLSYTFNLRSNAYYSNGDPVNAYVVWYNIYRTMLMAGTNAYVFEQLFNTSGVTVGDLNALNNPQNSPGTNSTLLSIMQNSSHSITVLNSTSVQMHLTAPFVGLLYEATNGAPWLFHDPYEIEQHGGVVAGQPNSWMALNGTTVGDGPYVESQYVVNEYIVLKANPHYWAQNFTSDLLLRPAQIPTVTVYYQPTSELVRGLDLQSNKVQAAIISFTDVANIMNSGNGNYYVPQTGLSSADEFLTIDTEKAPTNNILVRRAIVDAINVSEILSVAYGGYGRPFVGPNLIGFFGYNSSLTNPSYNITEAKALLVEAGYPNGNGLPPLNLVYFTSDYLATASQIVQQDLAQIGITIQPEEVSISTFSQLTYSTPGNSTSAPYLNYNSWLYWPDFTGYEFTVDQQLGTFFYLNNQTIHNLIEQSNSQINPELRAQEISQITVDVKQQASDVWISQDYNVFQPGLGFGPYVWNKCVTGMWSSLAFIGVPFNSLSYACNP